MVRKRYRVPFTPFFVADSRQECEVWMQKLPFRYKNLRNNHRYVAASDGDGGGELTKRCSPLRITRVYQCVHHVNCPYLFRTVSCPLVDSVTIQEG